MLGIMVNYIVILRNNVNKNCGDDIIERDSQISKKN